MESSRTDALGKLLPKSIKEKRRRRKQMQSGSLRNTSSLDVVGDSDGTGSVSNLGEDEEDDRSINDDRSFGSFESGPEPEHSKVPSFTLSASASATASGRASKSSSKSASRTQSRYVCNSSNHFGEFSFFYHSFSLPIHHPKYHFKQRHAMLCEVVPDSPHKFGLVAGNGHAPHMTRLAHARCYSFLLRLVLV